MSVKTKNEKGEWAEIPSIKGSDGVSPVVEVTETEGGHIVEISDVNGTKTFEVLNGKDGQDGTSVTVASVKESTADGGSNVVTFSDGKTITIKNGSKGSKGDDGISPTVEVTESENGHIVKIGEHTFEVLNGKDGEDSTGGGEVSIDEIDAEKVFFSTNLITTKAIGNITLTNGQATINAKGKNLKQVWNTIFVKEQYPSKSNPYVSLTFNEVGEYEVGTKITPSYKATLYTGSYTYGPSPTGVKLSSSSPWKITDTKGNTSATSSGSFPEIQVQDDTEYKITAVAYHTEGAIPVTNIGNPYPSGKIAAGSKSKTSGAVTGYRNSFYGTVENKDTVTASIIRGLTPSDKGHAEGDSFVVEVPVGALRVIIAYPSTLRDITSIKDVNASRSEISSSFKLQTVDVPGANGYKPKSYKVYTMDFAEPYDTANTFEVTI